MQKEIVETYLENQANFRILQFRQPMNALMSNEFSPEAMMSLEFTVDTPLEQLGEEMAQAMGEKETDTIRLIVQHIKQEKVLDFEIF